MTLLIVSFIAGVLTVLAPCILPLLPVIIGGSLTGRMQARRAFTIVIALGVSVILFTLLLKASTLFIMIPESVWKWISGGIVIVLGVVTIFPSLWERIPLVGRLSRASNKAVGAGYQKQSFWGDVIVGAALGPVFSSCSPTYFIVLASVLPVSPFVGFTYLLAYAVGLSLALLVIAIVGQRTVAHLGIAANPRGWFKRTLGVIFIVVGIGVITGVDKDLQVKILDSGFFDVTQIEQKLLGDDMNGAVPDPTGAFTDGMTLLTRAEKSRRYELAKEISTPDGFVNTDGEPVTLAQFKGEKVVLLDIWTYSCINCQRTIPYLNAWYEKYADEGFEIIGLHTPEFSFEQVQENVEDAVEKFGIKYPVVLDNDYSTWRAYDNKYWPRKYLIDIDGYIVYNHIGEGAYDETERAIQLALKERHARLGEELDVPSDITDPEDKVIVDRTGVGTPELYFGSRRNTALGNGMPGVDGTQTFILPATMVPNAPYLDGPWTITPEYAESMGAGGVTLNYRAKDVYMVASAPGGVVVTVTVDGVEGQAFTVREEGLYTLVAGSEYGEHAIGVYTDTPGLRVFTFTFG